MTNNARHDERSPRNDREVKTTSTKNSGNGPRGSSWKYRSKEQSIIAQVREILLTDGYASLSLRRVAEACSMSLGNLQYYFPTRESLVIAFVRHWILLEARQRERLKARNLGARQLAAQWVDDLFDYLVGNLHGSVLAELWAMALHDVTAREELHAWYDEERAYYSGVLRDINPGLSARDAQQRVRLIEALVEGLIPQVNGANLGPSELKGLRKLIRQTASHLIGPPARTQKAKPRTLD
jgi:AcrR family transcriptional regulator